MRMEGDRKDCLIKISLALKLQHSLMRELLLYIKDPVLIADPGTLARLPIERAVVESINRVGEGEVDSVRQRMEQDGIGIISIIDEDYPGGASSYILNKVLNEQDAFKFLDSKPETLTAKEHRPPYGTDGDYYSKPSIDDVFEKIYKIMKEYNPDKYKLDLG